RRPMPRRPPTTPSTMSPTPSTTPSTTSPTPSIRSPTGLVLGAGAGGEGTGGAGGVLGAAVVGGATGLVVGGVDGLVLGGVEDPPEPPGVGVELDPPPEEPEEPGASPLPPLDRGAGFVGPP